MLTSLLVWLSTGPLVVLIVCTPLIGSVAVLAMPSETPLQVSRVKLAALWVSLVTFFLSMLLWVLFDTGATGYQMVTYASAGFAHVHLGVDALSLYFVLLTSFLTPVCLLASWDNVGHSTKLYFVAQLVIAGVLTAVFVVLDLLLFYVAFETVLVPLFLVVGLWGGSPTRVRSALLLFLYTLAGSLFMLLAVMAIYAHAGTTDLTVLAAMDIAPGAQRLLWLGFFLALAVKTPLVPFHVWLPRAHADAPLAGSMVLAGTVLKLATYGFLRVVLPVLPDASAYYTPLVQTVAVVSLVYSSLATLRQVDFKALVAYSSVSHMAVVVLGLFSNTLVGVEGAIVLSLAHGLISPALFMLVGGVLYDRFHTRAIRYYRGLAQYMPVFSVLFFVATCANMGTPPSLNWAAEFMALAGAFQSSPVAGALGASGILLSAGYSIWLWGRLVAGSYGRHLTYTIDVTRREVAVLAPLLMLALLFGIVPSVLLDSLHVAVSGLLYVAPLS
jgi:NADH-ubiquinone oxidoreductase chain 4